MASRGTGIEKLPVTGSTVCAESTNSIPWFSGAPLKLSLPSSVRTTPGTRGKAALNFCSANGRGVSCEPPTVALESALSVETSACFVLHVDLLNNQIQGQADVLDLALSLAYDNAFSERLETIQTGFYRISTR